MSFVTPLVLHGQVNCKIGSLIFSQENKNLTVTFVTLNTVEENSPQS